MFFDGIDGRHTMWLGAGIYSQNGVDMHEAFTVGNAAQIGNVRFGNLAGLVYPTDSNRLCNSASGFSNDGVITALTTVAVTLGQQFSDFGTATMPASSSWIDISYVGFGV